MSLFTRLRQLPDQDWTPPTDDPPPAEKGESAGSGAGDDTGSAGSAGEVVGEPPRPAARRIAARSTTVLAALLVLVALTAGNTPDQLTLGTLARIPVEALLGAVLILALRPEVRRAVAVLGGVGLGLLGLLKVVDMGFHAVLARQFDPVLDWTLLDDAISFLTDSFGRGAAIAAAAVAALLAVLVVLLITLSVLRLADLVARHSIAATRTVVVLGAAWLACAVLGVQIVPGVPVAARNTAGLAYGRAHQIRDGLRSQQEFTKIGALLDAGTRRLAAAGFASRSAFLTSPTTSSGSWLAHSTFLSGLWIDNQRRYRTLVTTDRLTLTGAFRRANWRTVGIMPGVTRAWPEGKLYDYEKIYDSGQLGYHGPKFSWATVPRSSLRRTPAEVRADYRQSIEYSLTSLISYVERYGDDDTVLLFLGDHQPSPVVTGAGASRDVPIAMVARDPVVLDRISLWGWQDGLRPGQQTPVWRMDSFRDRFLTAFGAPAAS